MVIYSLLGGALVRRYLPSLLVPLGAAVVGAVTNANCWVSLLGSPKKTIYIGALMSAFFSFMPVSPIAATLSGSSMYSLYYFSKHRGAQVEKSEFF